MSAARFALAVLLGTAAGLALVSRLARRPRSGPGLLGLAFFTGALATALWTHLLLIVRVPVALPTVLAGPLLMLPLLRPACLREAVWRRPPWPAWLLVPAAAFLIGGALSWPLLGFDADAFYAFKARSITAHGTLWNPDFTDPVRIHQAHRRPLLLPCLYANLNLLTGVDGGRPLRLWFALLEIAALAAFYDAVRGRCSRNAAALTVAFAAWLPVLWRDSGGAVTAYADAPLAMIFLLALASETPLAVLLLTTGALMKDEGVAFLVGFALVRGWRPVVIPAVAAGAWMAVARLLPTDADYLPRHFLAPHPANLPVIARQLLSEFAGLRSWSILWIAGLATLAGRGLRRALTREDARWLIPLGMQLGAYIAVWSTMPPDTLKAMIRVEDTRLLMHLAPSFWAWTVWTVEASRPAAEKAAQGHLPQTFRKESSGAQESPTSL